MSQPASNQNEPSKMKKLLNGDSEDTPISRLPRGTGGNIPRKPVFVPKADTPRDLPATTKSDSKPKASFKFGLGEHKFMAAFWTIASVMSFTVNIVLVIVLLIVLQNFNTIGITVNDLSTHLLGGLYTNFVKMDQAHIKTTIPIRQEIPVQFTLNVSGPTNVTLSEDVSISGALVTVNTGGLNINNARANIVLPQGTVLPIFIQSLAVPVDQKVLAEFNVEVDIPLNGTDLHEPFVGLQKVVEPFYCIIEPFAQFNGVNVANNIPDFIHNHFGDQEFMKNPLTIETLSNGLKVLLKEIHTAPIISSWLWYRVGSRDEVQGRTGVSHWVEHMQFKGTPQFPANILDKAISREGGTWNAMTYLDWTAYYETMPADKIDLALRLESDRMVNSRFDESEVTSERTVIISEREGNENEPHFLLGEAVQQTAFRIHPYHHEVIGDMADLHTMTRDDLYNHYRAFYIPNNAVMAIAGDFDTDTMLARITELFEPIPAGTDPTRLARNEPSQNGEVRLSVEGPGATTYVQTCYRFPAASHPDFFPLSVLDSLLAGPSNLNMFSGGISNKTSRLYRALVDKELAVSVHGGAQATIDPFLYTITMTIHPKRKPEEALAVLDKEIQRVKEEKVTKEEIARAIKQARALFAYGSENITNQAFWLGYAEMFANYEWFQTYLDKLSKVTAKDIQRVANEYFKLQSRVVGTYVPQGGEE